MNAILLLALVAEAGSIDRGELKAGAPLTQAFRFTNRSPKAIEITGVNVSCGCTKTAFDRTKLLPGETATLTVEINTLAQAAGSWNWKASVRFKTEGSTSEDTVPVEMNATLVREVTLIPPGLAFSTECGSLTQEIIVRDSRGTPLSVKAIASSSKYFGVSMQTGQVGETRLRVTLGDDVPTGEHTETILLTTNDVTYPELRIPVSIHKKGRGIVRAYPEEVTIDPMSKNERILIRRTDGKPIQIANCELDDSGFTFTWSKGLDVVATVVVKAPDRTRKGSGRAKLRIKFEDPAGETIVVPVHWGE